MKHEIAVTAIGVLGLLWTAPLHAQEEEAAGGQGTGEQEFTQTDLNAAVAQALQDASSQLNIPGLTANLEFKTLASGIGGIDYRLEYTYSFADLPQGASGTNLRLEALSTGFLSDGEENGVNSIISELRLTGQYFSLFGDNPGSFTNWKSRERRGDDARLVKDLDGNYAPAGQVLRNVIKRKADLATVDADGNFTPPTSGPDAKKYRRLDQLHQQIANFAPQFLEFDVHIKSESDQKFHDHQYAVGVGLTTDSALIDGTYGLARILDAPFGMLRNAESGWSPQLPRFYVGYDYVTKSDLEARRALTSRDDFSRLTLQAAWLTSVLDDILIRVSWQAYYELDAPRGIKDAGEEWTSFLEITASFPIQNAEGASLVLKYVDGDLPSTLENSSEVSVGLSINF